MLNMPSFLLLHEMCGKHKVEVNFHWSCSSSMRRRSIADEINKKWHPPLISYPVPMDPRSGSSVSCNCALKCAEEVSRWRECWGKSLVELGVVVAMSKNRQFIIYHHKRLCVGVVERGQAHWTFHDVKFELPLLVFLALRLLHLVDVGVPTCNLKTL
jgi:hypothetical protein